MDGQSSVVCPVEGSLLHGFAVDEAGVHHALAARGGHRVA